MWKEVKTHQFDEKEMFRFIAKNTGLKESNVKLVLYERTKYLNRCEEDENGIFITPCWRHSILEK
jgi:hypothetical protein